MSSMQHAWLKNTYWPFVGAIAGLLAVGLLFVYSASHYDPGAYEIKQIARSWGLRRFFTR